MDAGPGISYMAKAMRLLLLLSAFLTALTGVVSGAVASAQPVQASASVAQAKPGKAITIATPLRALPAAFTRSAGWHVAASATPQADRASFGERRRL
jgi:hypothetical protein